MDMPIARRLIPAEGVTSAPIVLVGEAPGVDEDRLGRPFVGKAGKLLDRLLASARINRHDCYITNVIKFHPPSNYIPPFIDLSKKVPYISPEAQHSIALLKEELSHCEANVFVALGNIALFALTGIPGGITKYRGSVLPCTLVPGKKVLACNHPSYAFDRVSNSFGRERPLEIRLIVKDLDRAREEAEFPEIKPPRYNTFLDPTFGMVEDFLKDITNRKPTIGFDIEVMYGHTYCIGISTLDDDGYTRAICINLMKDKEHKFSLEEECAIWKMVAAVLEDPRIRKVMQNGIFDMSYLWDELGIRTVNFDDTMIAHALLLPDYPKGLDFITSTYTHYPYYKDEGKVWKKLYFDEVKFWEYNAKDAVVCLEVMPQLREDLRKQSLLESYQCHLDLIPPFMFIQACGIKVDTNALDRARMEAEQAIDGKLKELISLVGHDINPASPKQVAEYFYIEKGIEPYTKRVGNKSVITTDETALKRLSRRGFREATVMLDLRYWQKLKGTYLDMTLDKDRRFRGSINPVGTKSGRPSSSKSIKGTGGNMFNQPPEMDRFFVADEGWAFASLDLSQAENRIVAYLAPEDQMIDAFENGKDVHCLTGALISGLSYDVVKQQATIFKEYKARHEDPPPEVCSPIGRGDDTWRQWGKKCNHALNYGLAYKKFSLLCEIQESEAQTLVNAYHRAYPGVELGYQAWIKRQLGTDRTLSNPYGRRRVFLDSWGDDLFREAYSWIPQSIVSYKMWYEGIIPLYNLELYHPLRLVNCVYDSVVVAFRTEQTEIASMTLQALARSLERPVLWRGREIHIPVETKVGYNLGDMTPLSIVTAEGLANVLAETR